MPWPVFSNEPLKSANVLLRSYSEFISQKRGGESHFKFGDVFLLYMSGCLMFIMFDRFVHSFTKIRRLGVIKSSSIEISASRLTVDSRMKPELDIPNP